VKTFNVLRVVSRVLTDETYIRDLCLTSETIDDAGEKAVQLEFTYKY
jgi:hypothetical protein